MDCCFSRILCAINKILAINNQLTSGNNSWKIYGEGIGNQGRMVFEYETTPWKIPSDFDQTFVFRQKDGNSYRNIAAISEDNLKVKNMEANNIWKKIVEVD